MKNKFILLLGVMSLAFLLFMISMNTLYHYRHSVKDQKDKTQMLARTVLKSFERPMLEGKMIAVDDIITAVGKMEHIKRLIIADERGFIHHSSNEAQIHTYDKFQDVKEAINSKKEISGLEKIDSEHIYSYSIPLLNESHCYSCHGSERPVLGVLSVGMDWLHVRNDLRRILRRDIVVAMAFFLCIIILAVLFQRLYNNTQNSYVKLQAAQEQLVKTEKMAAIGQMAAAISHDLRNPLTGIKMATYYLGSKVNKNDEEINNILKDIELEINYASNVVTNILTYSRPSQLICKDTDINEVIEETMNFVNLQNRDAKIEIIKNYDKNMPEVCIDNKQVKQVVINLLSNAIQAMPDGGKLSIETAFNSNTVKIKISDTGKGIESKDIERLFTPFYTTKARGVGLGLAIVNNVVKKHGGSVEVNSVLGAGTSFVVILPINE